MANRAEKVANEVKKVLSGEISRIALDNGFGMATLTAVRMSKDLQVAKIYISSFGSNKGPGELIELFNNHIGELRYLVGKQLRLRFTPELRLFFDDTLDQIEHIQELLDKADVKGLENKDYNIPEDEE
jgi:ribosome-binding factor A